MNYSIRHYWVEQLNRVAFPVIDALSGESPIWRPLGGRSPGLRHGWYRIQRMTGSLIYSKFILKESKVDWSTVPIRPDQITLSGSRINGSAKINRW